MFSQNSTQVCTITTHTKVLVSQPRSPHRLYNSLANWWAFLSSQVPKPHIKLLHFGHHCALWIGINSSLNKQKEMRWNLLKVASLKVILKEASSWPGEFTSIAPTRHFYMRKRGRDQVPLSGGICFASPGLSCLAVYILIPFLNPTVQPWTPAHPICLASSWGPHDIFLETFN